MRRIAIGIHEITRVLAGEQTLFIRPARYSAARIEVGARLWVAEPFHLEPHFEGKAPTVALTLGAVPAFAADHLVGPGGNRVTLGKRHPARSMCREWHRAHVIVRSRTELRPQDLTRADLVNLGHASRESFVQAWNLQISEWRRTMKWADNPPVLKFGFELVREAIPAESFKPLPRDKPAQAIPADQPAAVTVDAAKAFSERHRQVRKLSATTHDPLDLGPRPVRSVAAPIGLTPRAPTIGETIAGVCRRCGSRLAFGCEHYPRQEDAA